jgi:hypothetical protein
MEHASKKSLGFYILIFILISVINVLIAQISILPSIPGFSTIYIAVAFMIPFALWFRCWGVLAAYGGCFIGAGVFSGLPLSINLYWSLADVWQVLIPLIAFLILKADTGLPTKRDFIIFLLFGCLLNNLAGALWGASSLAIGGAIPWAAFYTVFFNWFLGNLIITILITPILLRFITPYIRKAGVDMQGFCS